MYFTSFDHVNDLIGINYLAFIELSIEINMAPGLHTG